MTPDPKVVKRAVQQGYIIGPVYHGTTHRFTTFARERASIESFFGKGFYFTSSDIDADANYSRPDGADLRNAVERLAERIERQEEIPYEEAKKRAHEQLVGQEYQILTVALRMDNPFYIPRSDKDGVPMLGGRKNSYQPTWFDLVTVEDMIRIERAFMAVNGVYNFDAHDAWQKFLAEAADYGYVTADQFVEIFSNNDSLLDDVYDDNGDPAFTEVFRLIIKELGFDGIIDGKAGSRFCARGMNMQCDEVHFIVFEPNQIKLLDADTGTPVGKRFDPASPDIRNPRLNPHSPFAGMVEEGDEILDFDKARAEDFYRLFDGIHTARRPTHGEVQEIAGMLRENGVLAVMSGSDTHLAKYFHKVKRHGKVVYASHPKEPERARINAERARNKK